MAIRGLYRNRFDAKTTELWNVQFNPSLPEPFSNFVPCYEMKTPVFDVSDYSLDVAGVSYSIPASVSMGTLSLSFYDDVANTVYNYIRDRVYGDINGMFPGADRFDRYLTYSRGVRGVLDISFDISRLDLIQVGGELVEQSRDIFTVYPTGSLDLSDSSDVSLRSLDVDFVIIGRNSSSAYLGL